MSKERDSVVESLAKSLSLWRAGIGRPPRNLDQVLADAILAAAVVAVRAERESEKKAPCQLKRMCVCGHPRSEHHRSDGRLKCFVEGCACGPGCIHEGFVAADGSVLPDERIDKTPCGTCGDAWWAFLGRCLRCGKRRYFDGTTSCRKHYVEETIDVVHDIQREARQQALEEAAKECDSSAGLPDFVGSERMGAHVCARRIRALIDKPVRAKDPLCPTGECVGECDPEAHGLFSTRAKEEK